MARSLRHRIAPRYPTATTPISWEVPKQGRRGPKPKLQWAEAAIIELSAFGAAVVAPQEWAVPVGGRVQVRWGGLVGTVIVRRAAHYSRSSGLMLYGVSPVAGHDGELRTVMSLKSRVTLVRELPAGHGVSYGRSYVTTRPTLVATVGIGYGDGLPRQLSGTGAEVWLRGMRVPVIGRVTMDQIMLDASAVPGVAAGDEVEIFGPNIAVTEVASKAGTIPWEVFTGITPRVERHYLEGGLPFS